MPGRLTTHVLDTAHGVPAAGVAVELARLAEDDDRTVIARRRTDADGRAPLVEGSGLVAGVHELTFDVGEYFGQAGFLGRVPVRFAVADADAHYHVPLLVSPWAYSTYRGS